MILTVKQKLMYETLKKLYSKLHTKNTKFTTEYCKSIIKTGVDELYRIYPDKNIGKISVNWFDKKFNKTGEIDDNTYCFEINFHDVYTQLPWLICRFYKDQAKVSLYLKQ